MMTLEEIKNVSFRKANIGGYRVEDVDDFIDKVEETFGAIAQENRAARQKIQELNEKLADCKSKEDSIGQVLLNAQRQADSVVREAEQKSQIILEAARNEAQEIVLRAQAEIDGQKDAIEMLKKEVAQFKAKLLGVYREHLTLIDALPGEDDEKPAEQAAPQAEAAAAEPEKAAEPAAEPEAPVVQQPVAEEAAVQAEPDAMVDLDKFADEILAEEETIPLQPKYAAPAAKQEPAPAAQPRRGVSLFDDDYEEDFTPTSSRFESLKFGDDYDLKDDPDIAPGGRKKR